MLRSMMKISVFITSTLVVSSIDRNKLAIPERNIESNKRRLWAANIFANVSDPCDYISNDYPYVVRRTCAPTSRPTYRPTPRPTNYPTKRPSSLPSAIPSSTPTTSTPTYTPSMFPSISYKPTGQPTSVPSKSMQPSINPTPTPSNNPSIVRSLSPSKSYTPTSSPTGICGLTPHQRTQRITNIISTVSSPNDLSNTNSSQYKSLQWILYDDALGLCPQDKEALIQRYVLAVFYYSLNGDDWKECSYNSTSCIDNAVFKAKRNNFLTNSHECTWGGLECNRKDCLIAIMKQNQKMAGTLPSELGYLTCLKILDIDENFITGTIPDMFQSLTSLRTIDIDTNRLSGSLPTSLYNLQSLVVLDMNDNKFTGTLSDKYIGNMKSLEFFQIDNNLFTGSFPSNIGQLTNLHVFTATGLNMGGTMPTEVCDLLTDNGGGLMHLWTDCAGNPPDVTCDCCTQCASNVL